MADDAANGEEIYAKAEKKLKVRVGTRRSRIRVAHRSTGSRFR
jgi:hypothetical protein|tara:strand:- start:196 stop:324 length:129 start_codon:yes stop_codon:yes gene_type:complete